MLESEGKTRLFGGGAIVALLVVIGVFNAISLIFCVWYSSIVYAFGYDRFREPYSFNVSHHPVTATPPPIRENVSSAPVSFAYSVNSSNSRVTATYPSIREDVSAAISLTYAGFRIFIIGWSLFGIRVHQRIVRQLSRKGFLLFHAIVTVIDLLLSSAFLGVLGKVTVLILTLKLDTGTCCVPEKYFVQTSAVVMAYLCVLLQVLSQGLACAIWPSEGLPNVDSQVELVESPNAPKTLIDASTNTIASIEVCVGSSPEKVRGGSCSERRDCRASLVSIGMEVTKAELGKAKKKLRKVSASGDSWDSIYCFGNASTPDLLPAVAEESAKERQVVKEDSARWLPDSSTDAATMRSPAIPFDEFKDKTHLGNTKQEMKQTPALPTVNGVD